MPSDLLILWSGGLDSNQRPLDPQTKPAAKIMPSTCDYLKTLFVTFLHFYTLSHMI